MEIPKGWIKLADDVVVTATDRCWDTNRMAFVSPVTIGLPAWRYICVIREIKPLPQVSKNEKWPSDTDRDSELADAQNKELDL